MTKPLVVLLLALASAQVGAEVYKCQGADGKIQFSDTVCPKGNSVQVVPDRAPLTRQQQEAAQQRAQASQNEALAGNAGQEQMNADSSAPAQPAATGDSAPARKASQESDDAAAVERCVRDIERHGAAPNDKAEMIAACRTAGVVQRTTGISGDAVDSCVRNVERSGATEKEKVRQLALCHGGDVQPRVIQTRRPLGSPATP